MNDWDGRCSNPHFIAVFTKACYDYYKYSVNFNKSLYTLQIGAQNFAEVSIMKSRRILLPLGS